MLTIEDICKRAQRAWDKVLAGTMEFPWEIPLGVPRGQKVLEDFSIILDWAQEVRTLAQAEGLLLREESVKHRQLGTQCLPQTLIVPDLSAYLRWQRRKQSYESWQELTIETQQRFPALKAYLKHNPRVILDSAAVWPLYLRVLDHFLQNPAPKLYLRELEIQGVDSKFIEQHRTLLDALLFPLLFGENQLFEPSGSLRSFCERYQLKHDPILIRFRWLDAESASRSMGLQDLTVPLEDFLRLDPDISFIFITENKTNFLTFPSAKRALVIFGQGSAVGILAKIEWIQRKTTIYYWGDLDTHGFAILARLRRSLPGLQSLLMDRNTLEACRSSWVVEKHPSEDRSIVEYLSPEEAAVYHDLVVNRYGDRVRLEQERIPFSRVLAAICELSALRGPCDSAAL